MAFYPRVRKEQDPIAAATTTVRFLRERVTIDPASCDKVGPETVWSLGRGDQQGFNRVYVAALRSIGLPSRLNSAGEVEIWAGEDWKPAPQPLIGAVVSATNQTDL